MKKTDQELGMGRDITRRDLIHDAAIMTLGMGLLSGSVTAGNAASKTPYYPPTRTGLRGSHPGAFESAHALAREGKPFPEPKDLDEEYDLVIVGAGISGLAAAHYYRAKYGDNARILILENHDDFGGHAKRNEFHQSGTMQLGIGGTQNLEQWKFSDTVNTLMKELGVDTKAMRRNMEFKYAHNGSKGPALWFDADTYGQDKLVTKCSVFGQDPGHMAERVEEFPMSETARGQLQRFYAMRANVLEGKSEQQALIYLQTTTYPDFLRQYGGLGEEAIQLFANANHDNTGVENRSLSVAECLDEGMPGLQLLGQESDTEYWDYPVAMFPDGNASITRLLVQSLIPDVAPGANADNIALAKFDYDTLDRPDAPRRLRLNATVINTGNTDNGVSVTYISQGQTSRVKTKHCVMACYHVIIPHLCPQLPEAQKDAQKYQVKRPMLQTNVLIRSAEPMNKLGITGAHCPGRMHCSIYMVNGINTGGFQHKLADKGPVVLTFCGSISPPADVVDLKAQMRASRATMLALTFADYEREVRTVLDGMLGPAGFDVQRDILAITVSLLALQQHLVSQHPALLQHQQQPSSDSNTEVP